MVFKFPLPLLLVAAFGLGACDCSSGDSRPRRDTGLANVDVGPGVDGNIVRPDALGGCVPSPEGTVETCSDNMDNNCNGQYDCSDLNCSGVGSCPVCGQVDTPLGMPLSLPDGTGEGSCTTDSECSGDQRCFAISDTSSECREPYVSTLNFVGFEAGRRFEAVSDLVSVCVVMEHSWVRDLQMDLQAPDGRVFHLQEFQGREGGEVYLGEADDCDTSSSPSPGVGAMYCWSPTATNPSMFAHADAGGTTSVSNCNLGTSDQLPPGDYNASDPWTALIGAPLNGEWTLAVTDLWGIDNGYIFEWSIQFNAGAVEDCGSPLI